MERLLDGLEVLHMPDARRSGGSMSQAHLCPFCVLSGILKPFTVGYKATVILCSVKRSLLLPMEREELTENRLNEGTNESRGRDGGGIKEYCDN